MTTDTSTQGYQPYPLTDDAPAIWVRKSFIHSMAKSVNGSVLKVFLTLLERATEYDETNTLVTISLRRLAAAAELNTATATIAIRTLREMGVVETVTDGTPVKPATYRLNTEIVIEVPKPVDDAGKAAQRRVGYVYLMRDDMYGYHKIGYSKDPRARLRDLATRFPFLSLIHVIETNDQERLERAWHERAAAHRVRGEWFDLPDELVQQFRSFARVSYRRAGGQGGASS